MDLNAHGWRWTALASAALLAALLISILSKSFVFGVGHASRPILQFIALYGVWWAVLASAFWMLKRTHEKPRLAFVLGVALLLRVVLIASDLIQENDVYRYVLDGQVTVHGGNPYEFSPLEVREKGNLAIRRSLTTEEAQIVLGRIGYPGIPTTYPPAAQGAFALGALIGGWNWHGQRVVFTLIDLLVIVLLLYLLRLLIVPSYRVILYAWNPLILKEVINSIHLDVLVALFLILLLVGCSRFKASGSRWWVAASGLAWGMAVMTKIYPLLLGPACFIWLYRLSRGFRVPLLFSSMAGLMIITTLVPFFGTGVGQLTEGVLTFASSWRMNEGAFALVSWFFPNPRWISWAMIGLTAILLPLSRKETSVIALVETIQWILLIWFLLIPTVFPWYAIPIISLLVLNPGSRLEPPLVVLSGVVVLYYLSFFYNYRDFESDWWLWTRVIEHAAIWGVILWALASSLRGDRARRCSELSS